MQLFQDISEWKHEEEKNEYAKTAFLGWQIRNMIIGIFDGEPMEYEEYLNGVGLGSYQEEEITAKEAIDKAQNILRMIGGDNRD
ncbi:hypothetical protein LC040_12125 [Bacillus tianshenii]|nr:hypothetical protein LC040_12125 [Bacillus tianshenii]